MPNSNHSEFDRNNVSDGAFLKLATYRGEFKRLKAPRVLAPFNERDGDAPPSIAHIVQRVHRKARHD